MLSWTRVPPVNDSSVYLFSIFSFSPWHFLPEHFNKQVMGASSCTPPAPLTALAGRRSSETWPPLELPSPPISSPSSLVSLSLKQEPAAMPAAMDELDLAALPQPSAAPGSGEFRSGTRARHGRGRAVLAATARGPGRACTDGVRRGVAPWSRQCSWRPPGGPGRARRRVAPWPRPCSRHSPGGPGRARRGAPWPPPCSPHPCSSKQQAAAEASTNGPRSPVVVLLFDLAPGLGGGADPRRIRAGPGLDPRRMVGGWGGGQARLVGWLAGVRLRRRR